MSWSCSPIPRATTTMRPKRDRALLSGPFGRGSELPSESEVTLPLSKNKLIVFRCDALGLNYSYRPKGPFFWPP